MYLVIRVPDLPFSTIFRVDCRAVPTVGHLCFPFYDQCSYISVVLFLSQIVLPSLQYTTSVTSAAGYDVCVLLCCLYC